MRKALFLISTLFALTAPAFADEDDPFEIGQNFLRSHAIVSMAGNTIASGKDFERNFPIGEYGCQPRLNEHAGKDTIFVMSCPAYWGSGVRLKFGFVEITECGHACKALALMEVRVNDRSLKSRDLQTFLSKPFRTFPTFQSFLFNPNVKVFAANGAEIGRLQPSIQRLSKEGYNCELLYLNPKDSNLSILCTYNDNTSDPHTFDYDFKFTQSGNLVVASAHGRGRDKPGLPIVKANELVGSELLEHAQTYFGMR